jgi:hypothetical protein
VLTEWAGDEEMRFFCKIVIPAASGNTAIKTGRLMPQIQKVIGDLKPEAVYFGLMAGQRTMFMVVDLPSADKMPWTFEPFWLDWNADISITPVFTRAEMEKAGKDFEKILMERK